MGNDNSCSICGRTGEEPGISLLGRSICARCERNLVDAEPGAGDYDSYVSKVREVWAEYSL